MARLALTRAAPANGPPQPPTPPAFPCTRLSRPPSCRVPWLGRTNPHVQPFCMWQPRRLERRALTPRRLILLPCASPGSFHFRDACHKCGTGKPENAVELGLEYVGDGTQGYQQRSVERVPGSGLQPGQMARPGDWRCNMCNNVKWVGGGVGGWGGPKMRREQHRGALIPRGAAPACGVGSGRQLAGLPACLPYTPALADGAFPLLGWPGLGRPRPRFDPALQLPVARAVQEVWD